MKTVLQSEKVCYICQNTNGLHDHHIIFGTANRKNSERRGLKVWLCYEHHEGNKGVHFNRPLDLRLKQMAQEYYETHYGSRDDFRNEFGKSYL